MAVDLPPPEPTQVIVSQEVAPQAEVPVVYVPQSEGQGADPRNADTATEREDSPERAALSSAETTANATLKAAETAARYALLAALLSLFGAIIASLVAWFNGFKQMRTAQRLKHAEFRQQWIDKLRDDMARFIRLATENFGSEESDAELNACRAAIILRMNRKDPDFKALLDLMIELMRKSRKGDRKEFTEVEVQFLLCSQRILKREWEVTKSEMHGKKSQELSSSLSDNKEAEPAGGDSAELATSGEPPVQERDEGKEATP